MVVRLIFPLLYLSCFVFPVSARPDKGQPVNPKKTPSLSTRYVMLEKEPYISVNDLMDIYHMRSYYNPLTQKLHLRNETHHAVFVQGQAYFALNNRRIRLKKSVRWKKRELFIHVPTLQANGLLQDGTLPPVLKDDLRKKKPRRNTPTDLFEFLRNQQTRKPSIKKTTETPEKKVPEKTDIKTPEINVFPERGAVNNRIKYIVIDPGHGGKDPGAVGEYYKTHEKDINFYVARQLIKKLKVKFPEKTVAITRTQDKWTSLMARSGVGNKYARRKDGQTIYVAIHANWTFNKKYRGVETYYLGKPTNHHARQVAALENEVYKNEKPPSRLLSLEQEFHIEYSKNIAMFVQKGILKHIAPMNKLANMNNGILTANFWVLKCTHAPAILVEVGYLSNKQEENLLKRRGYQDLITNGIYEGICNYISYYNKALK